jgi:hypothetical protein
MSQHLAHQPINHFELAQAIETLREFFSCGEFDELQPRHPNAIYTTSLTLWLLIRQRLGGGQSLKATVKNLTDEMPRFVPDNKRIRQGLLSANTSSYSVGMPGIVTSLCRCSPTQCSSRFDTKQIVLSKKESH